MTTALLEFVGSLALLLVAANFFTSAAERVGLRLGMSPFVVGVFLVAVGTSLPELVASVIAVHQGTSEIVAGNVLGANASNLLMTLGVVSITVQGGRVILGEQYLMIDLHFLLGAMVVLGTAMADGHVTRVEGGLLLTAYIVYVAYLLAEGRSASAEASHAEVRQPSATGLWRDVGILIVAGIGIYFGGGHTVSALGTLALAIGISPAIASVTILSIGTTLPELAVSLTAARRGLAALAVGNILGSGIFNALAVAGTSALIGGVDVPTTLLHFALPFVVTVTLLFYLLALDKRISKWEGMLFLVLFALFITKVANLG